MPVISAPQPPEVERVLRRVAGAAKAPLRRNVTIEEVGNTAAFLCSDLASGISSEITYVDGGAATVSMPFEEPGEES